MQFLFTLKPLRGLINGSIFVQAGASLSMMINVGFCIDRHGPYRDFKLSRPKPFNKACQKDSVLFDSIFSQLNNNSAKEVIFSMAFIWF